MRQLTKKQRLFVEEYLKSWNATDAARKAGYKGNDNTLASMGDENLRKPAIDAIIQKRLNSKAIDADTTLKGLSDIATGDISDFISIHGNLPVVDFSKAERLGKMHLIKKLTMSEGKISFELYSKQRALETMARHHGLLNTKIEIDINLVIEVVAAIEKLGQKPSDVFNRIIQRAAQNVDADS
jgi:phage terminase small subunit